MSYCIRIILLENSFTFIIGLSVPEGSRTNHPHAAWTLSQGQRAAQRRCTVKLHGGIVCGDAVGPGHPGGTAHRAGYCWDSSYQNIFLKIMWNKHWVLKIDYLYLFMCKGVHTDPC